MNAKVRPRPGQTDFARAERPRGCGRGSSCRLRRIAELDSAKVRSHPKRTISDAASQGCDVALGSPGSALMPRAPPFRGGLGLRLGCSAFVSLRRRAAMS